MDDRFMNELRRDPDPKFARSLGGKLAEAPAPRSARTLRPLPTFVVAFAAVAVVALFVFPQARVSAQAMLDLFRVRKFAAVSFDESRIEKLRSLDQDNALMVFDHREVTREPGPEQSFTDPVSASAAAGFTARTPHYLPDGLAIDTVRVQGEASMRVSVSEEKLRALLEALDLRDVTLPTGLEGKVVEVHKNPSMVQQYRGGRWRLALVQSKSPELSVPSGLDIERLAEVGLRMLGLDAAEAGRIARNTDWRSTLVVPVPLNASTFRQISVNGQQGLLVTTTGAPDEHGERHRAGTVVMWTIGEDVFGLMGNLGPEEMLQIAESVK